MSDAVDHGITVTEITAMGQPIDVCPETTAAFVGRALRGPLNTPVLVRNFGEFRRRFGDVWGRSSLGPAAKQFFDHGGKNLYVVRVANHARGAMLCVEASGSALVLRAIDPGSTESIRAAVDYDGIEDDNENLFNLTLQRIDPATGHILDQEFFRRLGWQEEESAFIADELLSSEIARVERPFPSHRPDRTLLSGRHYESSYVGATQPGTDGQELSDYDLVGSRKARSGLFALEQIEHFDLLYLPPPGKERDVGPAAVLAAEMYCRERGGMLVVDPLESWQSATEAVQGVRDLGYASPNMLSYFPRVRERGDDTSMPRVAGGALAGLLCKQDRTYGPWQDLDAVGLGLQRSVQAVHELDDEDAQLLLRAGLNALCQGKGGKASIKGSVTMGRGSEAHREYAHLSVRRFCLQVIGAVARATRWAVFEREDKQLAQRLNAQVCAYFEELLTVGAFAEKAYIVKCDAGVSQRGDTPEHGITILLVFHPLHSNAPVSITLHQTASGCRIGSTAFAPTLGSKT